MSSGYTTSKNEVKMTDEEAKTILMGLKIELDQEIPEWSFSVQKGLQHMYMDCFCNFTDQIEIQILIMDGYVTPCAIEIADPKCFTKVVRYVKEHYRSRLRVIEEDAQFKLTRAYSKRMIVEQELNNEKD
jgi:hypothetical protein